MHHWFRALSFLAAVILPSYATACVAEKMKTTDNGFIFKIVGGSDRVEAKESPGSDKTAFVLDLLAPYFVICEEDQFYKITDLQAETVKQAETGKIGYVLKDHVHPWPTREALNFSAVAFTGERSEIVAWDDMPALEKFLETGNMKLGPPAFKENLESTLKRERATRPYPVLSSEMKQLRKSVDKRVFDVLLPAALPPEAKLVISTTAQGKENVVKKVESALTNATFVIAFDATGSMEKFAKQAAREMEAAFDGLPPQVVSGCKLGFVFFRDQDDPEKYAIVNPLPIPDAIKLLKDAATPAYMKGGGDPPEPVLDAVYIAHHLYPWGSDSNQTAGRRIIVAVLNDDAKPLTTGKIHDGVPPGIEPAKIAADLLTDEIRVISVQVGPGVGSHLVEVLSTLGEGTKGTFIDWGSGDLDERGKKVSAALSAQLTTKAEETRAEGQKIIGKIEFNYRGYPTIPLSVLDSPGSAAGEKLARLRNAGVKFNIDPGEGGVLIREGYILENPDLLEPQISIDKKTLDGLVTLFSALGVAGVDVNAMKESAGRALSAIAGENYDPKETIEVTIKKRLGIQFRSKLLSFNLEYLAGMTRDERLAMTKRIQEAGAKLSQFEDANLEALDKSPAVWMPVSQLP